MKEVVLGIDGDRADLECLEFDPTGGLRDGLEQKKKHLSTAKTILLYGVVLFEGALGMILVLVVLFLLLSGCVVAMVISLCVGMERAIRQQYGSITSDV